MAISKRTVGNIIAIVLAAVFVAVLAILVNDSYSLKTSNRATAPGVAWKVPYASYPELQAIYEEYRKSCEIPPIPPEYHQAAKENELYQSMRNDIRAPTLPADMKKYEEFEKTSLSKLEWAQSLKSFYSCQSPYRIQPKCDYVPRLGCYRREISADLEQFATKQIQALMTRLGLPNRLERLTDSRGATYMPPGGFMEFHSNQDHFGGWRLYMHYLPQGGKSAFVYQHPYDGSRREIEDNNEEGNLFRIRKPPKRLLWHGIYSEDAHRFSWGIWLPPELAQHLKTYGRRM